MDTKNREQQAGGTRADGATCPGDGVANGWIAYAEAIAGG